MIDSEYEILRQLCKVEDQPLHIIRGLTRFSKRMRFIIDKLCEIGTSFEVDSFDMGHHGYFKNIIAYPTVFDKANDTLILMAHHDVYNTTFENANDNSASISILLRLIRSINKINLTINVVVIFTDDEEMNAFGSQHVTEEIIENKYGNVLHVVNLELCGRGNKIWLEKTNHNNFLEYLLQNTGKYAGEITCPFNDASNIRRHGFKEATTIGTLYEEGGSRDTSMWDDIHSKEDKFDLMEENSLLIMREFLLNSIINLNSND